MTAGVQTRTLADRVVSAYMADSSAASSAFGVSPWAGTIIEIWCVRYNAITSADSAITAKINATLITGATMTLANSGSAAGDVNSCEPTAANTVKPGDNIEFISDGGASTTCPTMFYALIRDL